MSLVTFLPLGPFFHNTNIRKQFKENNRKCLEIMRKRDYYFTAKTGKLQKSSLLKKTVAVGILSFFSVDCWRFLRRISSVTCTPQKASQHSSTITSTFMGNAVIILMAPKYVPRLKRTLWGEALISNLEFYKSFKFLALVV